MTKKTPKLLPCPFCGNKKIDFWESHIISTIDVSCPKCGLLFAGCGNADNTSEANLALAIKKWNTRKKGKI